MPDQWLVLKSFVATPSVFLVLFMWVMCAIVSVKTMDIKPVKWIFILTTLMLVFRMLPL